MLDITAMATYLTRQTEYDVRARRISGTRAEKLEQLDSAIQELLDIKALECASDRPGVQFLAVPRPRSHALAMTVAILAMLVLLILLLGVRVSHAQTADPQPPATPAPAAQASPDESPLAHIKFGAALEGFYEYDANHPDDRVIPLRAYDTRANVFGIQQAALVIDDAPDLAKGRRYGMRLDFQFGQAVGVLQGNPANEPRYEHLADNGLFGGIKQTLQEVTFTAEHTFAEGFLLRGEFRRDWSDTGFFPAYGGRVLDHQNTALVGMVWWIGNKTGGW